MSKPRKKRAMTLTKLTAEIDAIAVGAREYRESEDCADAEYAQTFGYGDGYGEVESRIKDMDDELKAKVEAMRSVDPKRFYEHLAEVCDLRLVGLGCSNDEVFSVHLGEVEEQLDGDIREQVMALTPIKREALRKMLDEAYLGKSDCIYINMDSDRWVMEVNASDLDDWLRRNGIDPETEATPETARRLETNDDRRAVFRLIIGGAA